MISCDLRCHDVNVVAKEWQVLSLYVPSTFAKPLIVLDCDPQGDRNMDSAMTAGASARANLVQGLTAALHGAITELMPLTS
jgi:hypothetical protein